MMTKDYGKPPYTRKQMIDGCIVLIQDRMRYAMGIATKKGMHSERVLSKNEVDWFSRAHKTLNNINDDQWSEIGYFKDPTIMLLVIGQRDARCSWKTFIWEYRQKYLR